MTILSGDIKLLASEVMTDDSEGGGAPVATLILDGASNSIFPDISEVDRAGGVVNLRKVFVSVQTANADTYFGSNVLISDPPDDQNVSTLIFEAGNFFETRADAQDRVEAYLYASSLWAGMLLENHISGQKSLQICQRVGSAVPEAGQTLYLVQNEGLVTEFYQYVRVKSVSSAIQTFSYLSGSTVVDFDALVVTCEITDALRSSFTGTAANRSFSAAAGAAKIRNTLVADATNYYGAMPLATPVSIGDVACEVDSIFAQLVPSAQTEIALVNKSLTSAAQPMVASAPGTVSRATSITTIAPGGKYVLPTGCYPGSLAVATPSGALTDDALGKVFLAGSAAGTINYATGEIALTAGISAGSVTEVYRPAAAVSMQAYTLCRAVTPATRAYVWVLPLTPLPGPGTLTVSYMAQGDWYDLVDNGAGVLAGSDASYGAGTVSYVTGTVSVTLGALPDVGSEIIVSWGTPQEHVLLTEASLAVGAPKITFNLGQPVAAGTLSLSWLAGGVAKSASDNGAAAITGDASGAIFYGTGEGWFRPGVLPDPGAIAVSYYSGSVETYGATVGNGTSWSVTLPNQPIKPKSLVLNLSMAQAGANTDSDGYVAASSKVVPITVRDDGAGGLVLDGYGALPGSSINYTTGALVLVINHAATLPVATYANTTPLKDA